MGVIDNALEKLRRSGAAPNAVPRVNAADPLVVPVVESIPVAKRISVDLEDLRAAGYLPEKEQEARFADYYRAIKRPLVQKALNPAASADQRLILVSSALPGDGKTFTTINLALSLAREHDVSVLLVDADLPKGHISRALGLQNEQGLVDSLLDPTRDVESFVIGTNIPGLDILPSGRPAAGATELIASARMGEVARRLSTRNPRRLALFDTPPLLVSSEARALVQLPAQVILVARAGRTPRQALLDVIAQVDKKKLQSLVLNDAYVRGEDSYYGYYGYGNQPTQDSN